MENIGWKDHMTNDYVLDQENEKRKLLNTILEKKKRWLVKILRGVTLPSQLPNIFFFETIESNTLSILYIDKSFNLP